MRAGLSAALHSSSMAVGNKGGPRSRLSPISEITSRTVFSIRYSSLQTVFIRPLAARPAR
jgi:hypothetical protein